MTTLIATVTPRGGWLSQDTAVSALTIEPDMDMAKLSKVANLADGATWEDVVRSDLAGDGHAKPAKLLGFASKIGVIPHLNMVAGSFGTYEFHLAGLFALFSMKAARTVEDVDAAAPALLARLAVALPSPVPQCVVCIGYSHARGRVLGFAYHATESFRSMPIDKGHTFCPVVSEDDPDYAALHRACEPAAIGVGTEQFHVAVARNQFRAQALGLYTRAPLIGGQLHTARVDAGGITITVSNTFPDLAVEPAADPDASEDA
jgi:hypothetical protein